MCILEHLVGDSVVKELCISKMIAIRDSQSSLLTEKSSENRGSH